MIRKVVSIFAKEGGYFGRHFGILEWINSVYASATDFSISWCCWRYGSCQNIRSYCSLDCILLFVCLSCVVLFGLMAWPQRLNKHDYYLWLTSETYNQYENGFCTDLSQRPTSCTLHCICAACATSRERQSTPTVWRQMTTERRTCNSSPSTSWPSYIVAELWQLSQMTQINEVLECRVDDNYVSDHWCLCNTGLIIHIFNIREI